MIQLQNVTKSFKNVKVLEAISLEMKEGECVILNGVSGSGKSTLLSIIASLMKPSSGTIRVDGLDLLSLNDFRLSDFRANTIGFVTQSFYLFERLSVKENLLPPLLLCKKNSEDINKKILELLELVNLEHKLDADVVTLSGGEKQRCTIARALANNPKVVLFDEPTANLDKQNTQQFIEILKKLKGMGKTVLVATHDPLISNLDFVDTIINIKDGKIE